MKATFFGAAILVGLVIFATPTHAQRGYGWSGYGYGPMPFGGYGYGSGFSFSLGRGAYAPYYSPYNYGYGPYGYGSNPALGYPGGGYSYPYLTPRYDDYYSRSRYYIPSYSMQVPIARIATTSVPPDQVRLQIILPQADAELTFNGNKEPGAGKVRIFQPAGLEPGYIYSYKIGASWEQNGQPVLDERNIDLAPGSVMTVDFTKPAVEKN